MEELNKSGTMTIMANPDVTITSIIGKVSSWPAGPCILTLDPEKHGEETPPNLVGPRHKVVQRLIPNASLSSPSPSPKALLVDGCKKLPATRAVFDTSLHTSPREQSKGGGKVSRMSPTFRVAFVSASCRLRVVMRFDSLRHRTACVCHSSPSCSSGVRAYVLKWARIR